MVVRSVERESKLRWDLTLATAPATGNPEERRSYVQSFVTVIMSRVICVSDSWQNNWRRRAILSEDLEKIREDLDMCGTL